MTLPKNCHQTNHPAASRCFCLHLSVWCSLCFVYFWLHISNEGRQQTDEIVTVTNYMAENNTAVSSVLSVLLDTQVGINTQWQQVDTSGNKAVNAGYHMALCLTALSHINNHTVVLLCTYANVLIKCAINNLSTGECWVVETASQRHSAFPLMSLFLVVHYLRGGEHLPELSSPCMFRPAGINIWWLSLHTIAARCPDSVQSGPGHVLFLWGFLQLSDLVKNPHDSWCQRGAVRYFCQPVFMWLFIR